VKQITYDASKKEMYQSIIKKRHDVK